MCVHVCARRVCVCCGCQVPFHAQIECLSGLVGTSAWARAKRGAEGWGKRQQRGVSLSAVSHRIRLAHLPKHSRKSQPQPQPRPAHLRNLFRSVSDMAKYYLLSTPARPLPPSRSRVRGDKAVRQAGRKWQRVCVCV